MGVPVAKTSVVYPALDYRLWDPTSHRPRDLRAELGLAPGTFVYLYFGRPGVSKGIEYLLDAATVVRHRLPSSRLVLLLARNPQVHYDRLLRQAGRLGLGGHLIVLNSVPREELPGYLMAADCVVVPSISEGFGYSAVEAATLGRPVVATCGHASEEVLAGVARFVPPWDAAALADAVVSVARAAEAAAQAPRRFDLDSHVEEVLGVYDRLCR
jgi:glycosyltransferase involved in cell wall biosynthesis